MAQKKLAIATPTLEEALNNFLKEPLFCTGKIRADERETAVELLRSFVYYNGCHFLSPAERAFHDEHFNQAPPEHKGFHQIFGPAKIALLMLPFLDFMAREMAHVASQKFIIATCLSLEEFCLWLIKHGLLDPEIGEELAYSAAEASRNLPRAMRATKRLHQEAQAETSEEIRWLGLSESEHYRIARLHSNMLWLESEEGETIGPINVSARVKVDLEIGWEMHCSLIKRHNRWVIGGLGGVFPVITV